MYHCMKRILYVHANINGKYVIGARNTVWFKEKEECYFHHKKIIVKNVIFAKLFRPESVRVDIAGFGVAAKYTMNMLYTIHRYIQKQKRPILKRKERPQLRLETGTWLVVCKEGEAMPSVKRLSA